MSLTPENAKLVERVTGYQVGGVNGRLRTDHEELNRLLNAARKEAYKAGWNDREDDLLIGVERATGQPQRPSTGDGDVAGLVERLTKDAERLEACAGYAAHFGTPRAEDSSRWNRDFAADLRTVIAALSAPTKGCETCSGRGEIGGWFGQTAESGGYVTEPCPDCSAPTKGDELRKALEERDDARSTLEAWFDLATKTEEAIAPVLMAGIKGYLRTARNGGMPSEEARAAEAVLEDYIRLYAGRDLVPVLRGLQAKEAGRG